MYALQHTTGWYYVFNTDMQELQILWWTVSKEKENRNPEKVGYSWHMIVIMWQRDHDEVCFKWVAEMLAWDSKFLL